MWISGQKKHANPRLKKWYLIINLLRVTVWHRPAKWVSVSGFTYRRVISIYLLNFQVESRPEVSADCRFWKH